jgi:hypothetical protein
MTDYERQIILDRLRVIYRAKSDFILKSKPLSQDPMLPDEYLWDIVRELDQYSFLDVLVGLDCFEHDITLWRSVHIELFIPKKIHQLDVAANEFQQRQQRLLLSYSDRGIHGK